jgi:hypothetical protein
MRREGERFDFNGEAISAQRGAKGEKSSKVHFGAYDGWIPGRIVRFASRQPTLFLFPRVYRFQACDKNFLRC